MKTHPAQPLDLMQFINTRYHDPFIHEYMEFENGFDPEKLAKAVEQLAEAFPLLKCRYNRTNNTFIENEHFSVHDLVRTDDDTDRTTLLTEALDTDKKHSAVGTIMIGKHPQDFIYCSDNCSDTI